VHGITKIDAQNSLKNKVPAHASIFDQITKKSGTIKTRASKTTHKTWLCWQSKCITKTDAQNSLENKVPAHASIFDQITKFGGYGSQFTTRLGTSST